MPARLLQRHRIAVLGLCVVVWMLLLPLQSWAQTVMPWSAMGQASAEMAEAPPCHGAQDASQPAGCHDCTLCHWVAAPVPLPLVAAALPAPEQWEREPALAPPRPAEPPPFKPPRA